jgi:serine/threonine-protein kinase
MLTGARAFEGEDVAEVMASVMKSTPDWKRLPTAVPASLVTLIQRCLDKDRKTRVGDMAVARFLLADAPPLPTAGEAARTPAASAARRRATVWGAAALLAGTLLGTLVRSRPAGAPPVTHLQMDVLPAEHLVGSRASVRPSRTAIAVSPDGRLVAFAGSEGGPTRLYVRALNRATATPLPGTEGARAPFFSPDGAWVGFWTDDAIKKVPASGGPPVVVSQTGRIWGASWGEDGTVFFSNGSEISKVASSGGAPALVTKPDRAKGERHLLPSVLPGGDALLLTTTSSEEWEKANLVLHSIRSGEQRVLLQGGSDARYVDTGHLVYMRAGTLMAVPFDARSQRVTGAAVGLIDEVMHGINAPNSGDETGAGQFALSRSGTLVYAVGGIGPLRQRSLFWVDRKGVAQPFAAPPAPHFSPRVSPDGRRVAVAMRRGASRITDVWVYEAPRGTASRLTFEGGGGPVWSPDGKRIVYGSGSLFVISAGGSGRPERLLTSEYVQGPSSWASATNTIAFVQPTGPDGRSGIWALRMDGERRPELFLESRFALTHPDFSPDGRFIAYVSNESGTAEVYVQPYPGPGEKVRISTAGGTEPIWTANGRELLYRAFTPSASAFLSAKILSFAPFRADTPRVLFEARPGDYDSTGPLRGWDASGDGERFLLVKPITPMEEPVRSLRVVLNWASELKRRVPAK